MRRGKPTIRAAAPNDPPNSNSSDSPSKYLGLESTSCDDATGVQGFLEEGAFRSLTVVVTPMLLVDCGRTREPVKDARSESTWNDCVAVTIVELVGIERTVFEPHIAAACALIIRAMAAQFDTAQRKLEIARGRQLYPIITVRLLLPCMLASSSENVTASEPLVNAARSQFVWQFKASEPIQIMQVGQRGAAAPRSSLRTADVHAAPLWFRDSPQSAHSQFP